MHLFLFIHSFIHSCMLCMLCMHASYEYWGYFFHVCGDRAGMIWSTRILYGVFPNCEGEERKDIDINAVIDSVFISRYDWVFSWV